MNGWKLGILIFGVRKFSQSCRSHRSEHFCASFTPFWVKNPLPRVRSGWFKYQLKPLTHRMCFWNIWGVIGWKLGILIFGVRKFSQICRSHRSEHFCASFTPIYDKNPLSLVRSGWFKYQLKPLTHRICFWNIWSDLVKIGDSDFRGEKIFTKL